MVSGDQLCSRPLALPEHVEVPDILRPRECEDDEKGEPEARHALRACRSSAQRALRREISRSKPRSVGWYTSWRPSWSGQ